MTTATLPTDAHAALSTLRSQLRAAFIGRDDEVDGLCTALVARTHVLLLGPPGTAKSLLTQVFARALGGSYFQRLLTAFSAPEEVFGPYDLAALDAGKYERAVDGYMPTATTAFLDEVFKANSAVLNALLTLLNERQYDNGTSRMDCPLELCVGASNEYPADSTLDALYDRFTLRFWTHYTSSRSDRMRLLTCADPAEQVTATISAEHVAQLQAAVKAVAVPRTVLEALLTVADKLAQDHGLVISDRRLRQAVKLVQARALLQGRMVAQARDLVVLADSVWQRHEQRAAVLATVLEVAAPALAKARELVDAAREASEDSSLEPAAKLAKVQGVEDELRKHAQDAQDADVDELLAEVSAIRKAVARDFASRSGLLRALG